MNRDLKWFLYLIGLLLIVPSVGVIIGLYFNLSYGQTAIIFFALLIIGAIVANYISEPRF